MELIEAIYKRKSVRKYSPDKLSPEELNQIKMLIDSTEKLNSDIDLQIQLVDDGKKIQEIMRGIVGNFGKIVAPHYLLVTSEPKDHYLVNAGYATENLVLELTRMGIATCWLGGHVKIEDLRSSLGIAQTQNMVVIISLGHPEDPKELYRLDPSQAKRKGISEFAFGKYDDVWMKILDAVRIAPSAANSQPWRFFFDHQSIHVYGAKSTNFIMKALLDSINRVDMGIALSHAVIAARKYGKNIQIKRLSPPEKKDMYYIASIVEA